MKKMKKGKLEREGKKNMFFFLSTIIQPMAPRENQIALTHHVIFIMKKSADFSKALIKHIL